MLNRYKQPLPWWVRGCFVVGKEVSSSPMSETTDLIFRHKAFA
jgi:hypothetical protein